MLNRRMSDETLAKQIKIEAGKLVAQGIYPAADRVLGLCGYTGGNMRVRRFCQHVMDTVELPPEMAAKRRRLVEGQRRNAAKGKPRKESCEILDPKIIDQRIGVIRDYRQLFGVDLTTDDIFAILDRFDAALARCSDGGHETNRDGSSARTQATGLVPGSLSGGIERSSDHIARSNAARSA